MSKSSKKRKSYIKIEIYDTYFIDDFGSPIIKVFEVSPCSQDNLTISEYNYAIETLKELKKKSRSPF